MEILVKMVLLVFKVQWVKPEEKVLVVHPAVLVCLDSLDLKDKMDKRVKPELLVIPENLVKKDLTDNLVLQVQLAPLERPV